jgi:hypothetical protein
MATQLGITTSREDSTVLLEGVSAQGWEFVNDSLAVAVVAEWGQGKGAQWRFWTFKRQR